MCRLSEDNRRRLGNVVVYIANHGNYPCKTKVLKLIYLMEERCVLTMHTPFLGLPFEVWQHGPVEKDVFVELSDGPSLLKDFIKLSIRHDVVCVEAIAPFNEDEFSDNELHIMQQVMQAYGNMSATELVSLTHREGSPWYQAAKENNLIDAFNNSLCNSSNVEIDFSKSLAACDADFYLECLENHNAANFYGI